MKLIMAVWLIATGLALVDVRAQGVTRGTLAFAHYELVYSNYFKTKLVVAQLQEMADAIHRERALIVARFDALQTEIKNNRAKIISGELTEKDKTLLRKQVDDGLVELRRMEDRIKTFNETQNRRLDMQQHRIRADIMSEIEPKIADFARSRGYLAVIDRSQTNEQGVASVLYIDERADITGALIDELNK